MIILSNSNLESNVTVIPLHNFADKVVSSSRRFDRRILKRKDGQMEGWPIIFFMMKWAAAAEMQSRSVE